MYNCRCIDVCFTFLFYIVSWPLGESSLIDYARMINAYIIDVFMNSPTDGHEPPLVMRKILTLLIKIFYLSGLEQFNMFTIAIKTKWLYTYK